MGCFNMINENVGSAFKTSRLRRADAGPVARIMAVVREHFVHRSDYGEVLVREGSLTLQHLKEPRRVIKVLRDHDQRFCDAQSIAGAPGLPEHPIAVGVELTALDPFEREALRDALSKRFTYYLDPRRVPYHKCWLQPVEDHLYDFVVLRKGDCVDYEVSEAEVEHLARTIDASLGDISE